MKFYNDALSLVVVNEDVCAFWAEEKKQWAMGSVGLARDCWLDLNPISEAEAKAKFPEADFAAIPKPPA